MAERQRVIRPKDSERVRRPKQTRAGDNVTVSDKGRTGKPFDPTNAPAKYNDKREIAIAALLSAPNARVAARRAGVHHDTLLNWLKLPEFQEAYRQARNQVLETSISTVAQFVDEAVQTLGRNLNCGRPDSEIRAAMGVLHWATKFLPSQVDSAKGRVADGVATGTVIVVDGAEEDYVTALKSVS